MFFKSTQFKGSFVKMNDLPKTGFPEYAFIGRSNVGKSTLINFLVNSTNLAKVSNTPGKTQCLNYFLIDEKWYLVDLPGYGFAKVSKTMREKFSKLISNYVSKRETIFCIFLLIDSRIPPQKSDLEFISFLGEIQVSFVLVFTKADKYPAFEVKKNIEAFKSEMLKTWESLPEIFITSAEKKKGRKEILDFIERTRIA